MIALTKRYIHRFHQYLSEAESAVQLVRETVADVRQRSKFFGVIDRYHNEQSCEVAKQLSFS